MDGTRHAAGVRGYGGAAWPHPGRARPRANATHHGEVGPDRGVDPPRAARSSWRPRSSRRRRRTAAARWRSPRGPAASRRAATNSPHSRICGITTAGMNCTAWNSVRANADTNSPSAVPSTASATATTTSIQTGPDTSRPSTPDADSSDGEQRLHRGDQPERQGVADRGSRPCRSASRAAAPGCPRTARAAWSPSHQEHHDERDQREQRRAEAVEALVGAASRRTSTTAASAPGTAAPAASPACGGRGAAGPAPGAATAAVIRGLMPPPPLDQREERRLHVRRTRAAPGARRGVVGEQRAVAHQQQPVAALGLVHHVAGDQHRGARRRRAGGTSPTGRAAAPGRGRPSARRAPAARGCRAARPRARPGSAGRRRAGRPPGRGRRPRSTASMHRSASARGDAEHPGEEAEVLGDGQVVVDAGRLGDVADPVAQPLVAGRQAEHLDRAAGDDLHPDDRAHQRGLAAARRAEQPGHLAGPRREARARGAPCTRPRCTSRSCTSITVRFSSCVELCARATADRASRAFDQGSPIGGASGQRAVEVALEGRARPRRRRPRPASRPAARGPAGSGSSPGRPSGSRPAGPGGRPRRRAARHAAAAAPCGGSPAAAGSPAPPRQAAAHQRDQRQPGGGVVPHREEQPQQPLPGPGHPAVEHRRHQPPRVDRDLQGGEEEVVLGPEAAGEQPEVERLHASHHHRLPRPPRPHRRCHGADLRPPPGPSSASTRTRSGRTRWIRLEVDEEERALSALAQAGRYQGHDRGRADGDRDRLRPGALARVARRLSEEKMDIRGVSFIGHRGDKCIVAP